jgi:lysophospholipase L1-like esterase
MDISTIDKNFSAGQVDENGFVFIDAQNTPFVIEGLPWLKANNGIYHRLELNSPASKVNDGVKELSWHTAGACIRFRSDSPEIMIRAKLAHSCDMNHMPRAGSAGFDSFFKMPGRKLLYNKTLQPNPKQTELTGIVGVNPDKKFCDWVINFPLYGGAESVEIGLKTGSRIAPPRAHKIDRPVLFYGSSITQGGCASRPGNVYTSMLCRAVDAEQINLGFSGSARGELAMAEAINSLDLSVFVLDYDHNAPDINHLQKTHEPFFQAIRKAHPQLPVIMVSRCDFAYNSKEAVEICKKRRDVIKQTFDNAVKNGDKKVWFVDGETLFGSDLRDCCTVDGCHPNDLGFYRMYKTILPILKEALKSN